MEDLAREQDITGFEIERLISNYRKDGPTRKTVVYLSKRLSELNELWKTFSLRNEQLQAYAETSADHPYFEKDYFSAIQREYVTARDAITSLLKSKPMEDPSTPNPKAATAGASFEAATTKRVEDDTQGLINQFESTVASINYLIEGIHGSSISQPRVYYDLKSNTLTRYWEELRDLHRALSRFPGGNTSDKQDQYNIIEERIQDALINLATGKEKIDPAPRTLVRSQQSIKLPEMSIPKFDGDYAQWTSFHDLFHQIIDSQPLGNSQKMWYLKANLLGEAERLIKHMPISDENYIDAWTVLRNRYENRRLMVTALLDKLLSQPAMSSESARSIKLCHDITKECVLGLKNIKVDTTNWDPLLLHVMIKKLDKTSHNLYEQSLKSPRELQSLDSFLVFLEQRFHSLEALGSANQKAPPRKVSALVSTNQQTTVPCKHCEGAHKIFACESFKKLNTLNRIKRVKQLQLCLNCLRPGHKSTDCSSRACLKCDKKHNTLLHKEECPPVVPANKSPSQKVEAETKEKTTLTAEAIKSEVLLSTVVVHTSDNQGRLVDLRAILDSGSQVNLITEAALKKLNRKAQSTSISISSIGGLAQKSTKHIVLPIQSKSTNFKVQMNTYVVNQITAQQPSESFSVDYWKIPRNISLADPEFNQSGPVDMLIGVEHYYQLLSIGQIKLGEDLPVLQNTVFGWILGGAFYDARSRVNNKKVTCGMFRTEGPRLDEELERFWKLETNEEPMVTMTAQERKCEEHFKQTMKRSKEGRFIVRLPFLKDPKTLGKTQRTALWRLSLLEERLAKNEDLRQAYQQFMQEYLKLGHMTEVEMPKASEPHFILPHHCVLKPDSSTTKLRVVFDASAPSTSKISLNDVLHTGPTLQDELFTILLRFRLFKYVFSADIEKMYRQIWVDKEDRPYQMVLWRNHPNDVLRCYQLNTVTYGTTVAPYLATKCLEHLSSMYKLKYPLGSLAVRKDFYMDDLLTGANSLAEALQKKEEVQHILNSAGFKLRKWCANNSSLINDIDLVDREIQCNLSENTTEQVKTLGLMWLPAKDELVIRVPPNNQPNKITKRQALSTIAHIFDPLGLMSPVTITAKIFIQKLWKLKLHWDAALPMELHSEWKRFHASLGQLNEIKIPRHVFGARVPREVQLHAFADASKKAFGTAIYLRANHCDGTITVRLLCAKTRVTPINKPTIPRLELCAAKLATELVHRLQADLNISEQSCYFWTDSEIVLHWINNDAALYQTFVANRIVAIQQYSTPAQWRHVRSKLNPADLASRGVSPSKLKEATLWFYGPLFLHGNPDTWPATSIKKEAELVEEKFDLEKRRCKSVYIATQTEPHFIYQVNHGNSFRKLKCIVALVIRFTRMARRRITSRGKSAPSTVSELEEATNIIIKELQNEAFYEEIQELKTTGQLSNTNRLCKLAPAFDKDGLLRVGGRLENADLEYYQKHPILLPYAHPITKLILTQLHQDHKHAGPQALLAIARQRYWPINGKTVARSVVQNCVVCARAKPRLMSQLMGNLPANRVLQARPFLNTGVDFAGPFYTHFKLRGKQPQKTYLAVFCCFSTKAIHLELATELTTEAFIGALKRFVSRRGNCRNIYCDNATNFVGANNQFLKLKQQLHDEKSQETIARFCTTRGMDFHFIPPRSPHFGGLWEAAVKSAKSLILKSLANVKLTYEELETIIVEVEAILNSRPLTPLSSDPNDLQALTPGHFLIGEPLTSTVDVNADTSRLPLGHRWKLVKDLKHQFWQRWSNEYLQELQHRYKWKQRCQNASPGLMVVVKDDKTPVLKWPLGRIVNTIKGNDGLVRVVDVKTYSGTFRRSIHDLAPLPVNDTDATIEESPGELAIPAEKSSSKRVHETSDRTKSSKTKQRRLGNLVLQTLLLVGLVFPVHANHVKIQPFQSSPGLFMENLGPAHLVLNEWKLIVYYDLTSYWRELATIQTGINQLLFWKQLLKHDSVCEDIIQQLQSWLKETERVNRLMQRNPHDGNRLKRRGALNIVGNIASSLFGVLDSDYAEHMADTIERLEDSDQHLRGLIRNQTLVINSTVNIMAEAQHQNENRLNELESAMNKNIQLANNMTHDMQNQKILQAFTLTTTQLGLTLNKYQRTQSALWDSFIDSNHGKLNSLLLTPDQLQSAIVSIKENLPSNVRLPILAGELSSIYRIITIHGCSLKKKVMMFLLKIPLVSYEQFEAIHFSPIPMTVNGSLMEIELQTEFLIINRHRDTYYPISGDELRSCRSAAELSYLCNQIRPLYRRGSEVAACELSFVNHLIKDNKCQLRRTAKHRRWTPLVNPNHWIYVMTETSVVNIDCGKVISTISLNGSGILELPEDCSIKEETLAIQAHKIFPSSFKTHFLPTRNMSQQSFKEPFELKPMTRTNVSKENNFQHLQEAINTLLGNEFHPSILHKREVHQFAIGYSGLIIGGIAVAFIVWNQLTKRRKRISNQTTPIPAPRTRSDEAFSLRLQS